MKIFWNTLATGVIFALGFPFFVSAQMIGQNQEAITFFDADIIVNTDNSIDVTEKIIYQTGPAEHHGIYRDIYPYSSEGKKMIIKDVVVVDESGAPYQFQVSNVGKNIRIKIGDPNTTFRGEKTYLVTYHGTNAVAKLEDLDEVYWNVTGNEWGMPIYAARARVTLPPSITPSIIQEACYVGIKGSTNKCSSSIESNTSVVFAVPSVLNPGEGLTVAVGFPKGTVVPYQPLSIVTDMFLVYLPWVISILMIIGTFFFSFRYWCQKGRDPKGAGVIVPYYDVPGDLTPMEVVGILHEDISAGSISAEIVYLATKGYLKIVYLENKILGIFNLSDYKLEKLKDFSDVANTFDSELLASLFSSGHSESVTLSKLKNVFYKQIPILKNSTANLLLKKGYYKNLGRMGKGGKAVGVAVFLSFAGIWIFDVVSSVYPQMVLSPVVIGLIVSIGIFLIIYRLSPAKTEIGVATKEQLLGLKMYLQIAEKDRLAFHSAPEKKPEIFEKLLPYAMVLGVENAWAKEFEGIYTTPPSWYSGPASSHFSARTLSNSLASFGAFATTSLSSAPGGSGGGGSSGGGGGGGGGGSW
ncbi:MAG: hypothetical protein A2481_02345 [Candidatus Yonathbacteria bacterium RIFOXYC2_FULL_47_9]|nr:MAG: hypothetical protein A2481_02345 [Candidatus Yonathbacteria bacterium RIFOXYC2_FULL_47_9]HAT68539.1 hypothetical protein [Candidatus Yonathbacteria bacterium]